MGVGGDGNGSAPLVEQRLKEDSFTKTFNWKQSIFWLSPLISLASGSQEEEKEEEMTTATTTTTTSIRL